MHQHSPEPIADFASFLAAYIHQLEFTLVLLSFIWFLIRYRREMFAVFKKRLKHE